MNGDDRGRAEAVHDDLLFDPEDDVVPGHFALRREEAKIVVKRQLFDLVGAEKVNRFRRCMDVHPAGRSWTPIIKPDAHLAAP